MSDSFAQPFKLYEVAIVSIQEMRKRNLRAIIDQWGGPSQLAKKLGFSGPSYLSQMTRPKANRPITEKTAREIERKLSLPDGWLDGPNAPVDTTLLAKVLQTVNAAVARERLDVSNARQAELISTIYDNAVLTGKVDEALVSRIVAMLK